MKTANEQKSGIFAAPAMLLRGADYAPPAEAKVEKAALEDPEFAKGDKPGHEFHGNQFKGGEGGTGSKQADRVKAVLMSQGVPESAAHAHAVALREATGESDIKSMSDKGIHEDYKLTQQNVADEASHVAASASRLAESGPKGGGTGSDQRHIAAAKEHLKAADLHRAAAAANPKASAKHSAAAREHQARYQYHSRAGGSPSK